MKENRAMRRNRKPIVGCSNIEKIRGEVDLPRIVTQVASDEQIISMVLRETTISKRIPDSRSYATSRTVKKVQRASTILIPSFLSFSGKRTFSLTNQETTRYMFYYFKNGNIVLYTYCYYM